MTKKLWIKTAFSYLFIIALIGTFMRLKFVVPIGVFNYNFILHSHSHVAILGWVYSTFIILLIYCYLPHGSFELKKYISIFWLTQLSIVGMLIFFILQGYAAFSIAFSTLHILLSYTFIISFLKDYRKYKENESTHKSSILFVYASLFFLFLSSFGPWSLAILAAKKMIGTMFYTDSIYFYLHFQYNGWFTFALMGIFLWLLEKSSLFYYSKIIAISFWIIFISTIPAYLLSISFTVLPDYLIHIAFISGVVQLTGIIILLSIICKSNIKKIFPNLSKIEKVLLAFSIISLLLKFILQFLSGFESINHMVFLNRDIVIGFIHLVMLGFATNGLIFILSYQKLINIISRTEIYSIILFLFGFITTELLLFMQVFLGIINISMIPYHLLLFLFTIPTFMGIGGYWYALVYKKDLREI